MFRRWIALALAVPSCALAQAADAPSASPAASAPASAAGLPGSAIFDMS